MRIGVVATDDTNNVLYVLLNEDDNATNTAMGVNTAIGVDHRVDRGTCPPYFLK